MSAKNECKRIAVICGYPFPNGLAATTRILAYSKGLVENSIETDVFIFFPTDKNKSNSPIVGNVSGVRYHYPQSRTYPGNVFVRKLSHLYYRFITLFNLIKEHKNRRFDFVFLSTDSLSILYFFIPAINLLGSKPIFITDEYPTPIRVHLKKSIPKWKTQLFKYILKYVKGMVFMTDNLSIFYNNIVKKLSFILPTITDLSRFYSVQKANAVEQKYICYMGNMELSKDNVDNIIDAFNLIADKYSHIQLHLYGAPSGNDLQLLNNIITKHNLQERVIFKGKVSNEEVPGLLCNSYILVSSQPITKRAEGGFPTKLGEYMAAGIPTLLTDVGEITKYVTNGVNVWLAKACDPADYANKLEYIIENYTEALAVAERAKEYVMVNFDYKTQSFKLKGFLNSLM
jgi:glycosyltransferase involved in cell wall biosynthesis